jgi:hypothetical protein
MIPVLSQSRARRRPLTTSYRSLVLADSPLAYWPMDDASSATSLAALAGGTALSLGASTAKPTLGVAGKVDGTAVQFDGTNDYAAYTSNFAFGTNLITVEFLLWWDSFANDDHLCIELSTNFNNQTCAFLVNPNDSASGRWSCAITGGSSKYKAKSFTRPSASAWHHFAVVFDATTISGDVTPYLDGSAASTTTDINVRTQTSNFNSLPFYLMSRAGSSLFAAGKMQHLAIYSGALSSTRIAAHAHAAGF